MSRKEEQVRKYKEYEKENVIQVGSGKTIKRSHEHQTSTARRFENFGEAKVVAKQLSDESRETQKRAERAAEENRRRRFSPNEYYERVTTCFRQAEALRKELNDILIRANRELLDVHMLDVHYLEVTNTRMLVEERVEQIGRRRVDLHVVTGKGNGSPGPPVLKFAVECYAKRNNIGYYWSNPGEIVLFLNEWSDQ